MALLSVSCIVLVMILGGNELNYSSISSEISIDHGRRLVDNIDVHGDENFKPEDTDKDLHLSGKDSKALALATFSKMTPWYVSGEKNNQKTSKPKDSSANHQNLLDYFNQSSKSTYTRRYLRSESKKANATDLNHVRGQNYIPPLLIGDSSHTMNYNN